MKHLFYGGVHPPGYKELSVGKPLVEVKPRQVVIALQQHIGAPCRALVKPGARVVRGQMIGDGEGLCVPVHASVSGTVAAVEMRPHVSGTLVESVVIDSDGRDEAVMLPPLKSRDSESVLERIRRAGIVGMGGAAFPGHVKASSSLGKADTLIANGCECEPYITADDTLLTIRPRQVLQGLEILRAVVSPCRTVLAVEENKAVAIDGLRRCMAEFPHIELAVLPERYPQGSEKQLIVSVTGREVAPGQLPVSAGCAVFNVSTCAAVCAAVEEGMPLTERIVTVSGDAVGRPGNYLVPLGTTFAELIAAAGGLRISAQRVISGGAMMGLAQTDLSVSVVKGTNAVLCLGAAEREVTEPVCVRCGRCVTACPSRLQPLYLYRSVIDGDEAELERLRLGDCIE